jgi:hypothetical protein
MSALRRQRPIVIDSRRMFTRDWAAAYVGLTETQFEVEVVAGTYPDPVIDAGVERWDRMALDEAIDRRSGRRQDDWRGKSKLYGSDRPGLR